MWLTRPATTKTGYIETTAVLEGGIKHVKIPWQQWATESGKLKLALYTTKEIQNPTWNERKSQDVAAASKGTNFTFDEDIDADGSLGNVRVKISNESYNGENPTTARLILENIQITPWLLYTTKEATLDVRGENALTYTNPDLIDNTTGDDPVFSISENASSINVSIDPATGTVTAADRYQTGDITVQAKWSEVTTTYTLHVIGKADANAHFVNDEENKTLLDLAFNNPVVKAAGSANAVYSSEFDTVATVDPASGTVTIVAPGTTTITATIEENDNFQGAVVSYTLHIAAPNFYVVGSAVDSWDPNHVPVYADSYTIKNLAAGTPYMLKITRNGTWVGDDNVYGYDALTKSEMVVGITRGSGTDNDNICFTLAEAGDVTVTYTGEVFKVFGVFDPQTTIKVVGDDAVIGAWKYDDGITLVPTDDRKALSATVELTKGYYEFKVVLNNGNDWMGKNGNDGLFHLHRTYNSVSDLVKDQGNFKLTPDVAGDYTFTWAYGTGTLTVTYPDLPAPVYYLAGSMFGEGEWSETKQLMTEIDGVWSKTVSFESTDYKEFKIVRSVEGIYVISQDWLGLAEYQNITATTSDLVIGTGESNIGITPSKAGDYGFTFDPDGNKLSVTFPTATAIDETDVNVKAVKKVVDGQLIIEKKGVRYNVIGQVL